MKNKKRKKAFLWNAFEKSFYDFLIHSTALLFLVNDTIVTFSWKRILQWSLGVLCLLDGSDFLLVDKEQDKVVPLLVDMGLAIDEPPPAVDRPQMNKTLMSD